MQGDDGVQAVVLAGKKGGGLKLLQSLAKLVELRCQFRGDALALAGQLEFGVKVG